MSIPLLGCQGIPLPCCALSWNGRQAWRGTAGRAPSLCGAAALRWGRMRKRKEREGKKKGTNFVNPLSKPDGGSDSDEDEGESSFRALPVVWGWERDCASPFLTESCVCVCWLAFDLLYGSCGDVSVGAEVRRARPPHAR